MSCNYLNKILGKSSHPAENEKELVQLTPKKILKKCCVDGCANRVDRQDVKFYTFPSGNVLFPQKSERRKNWIEAVGLKNIGGSPIKNPSASTLICCEHFVGKVKSNDPRSPSYNPTIFPQRKMSKILFHREKSSLHRLKHRIQRFACRKSTAADIGEHRNFEQAKSKDLEETKMQESGIMEVSNLQDFSKK